MRKKHCESLISECEEILGQINIKFTKSFEDPENKEILEPKVKSFLEHCRSILEYCANDIFELVISEQERTRKLKSKYNKVYFPYGKTKKIFRSSVSQNLPGLKSNDEQVYNLVEALQDYNRTSEKVFLSYMCKLTNENKHNSLSEHQRQSIKFTNIGNFVKVDDTSSVNFHNCVFNGKPTGDFIIQNGKISGRINPQLLSEVFQYEEGEYVFKDTKKSVVDFLMLSLLEIKQFTNNLYVVIESKQVK